MRIAALDLKRKSLVNQLAAMLKLPQTTTLKKLAEATGQHEYPTDALCAQPGEVVELQGGIAERVADEYQQSVLVCHAHRADRGGI